MQRARAILLFPLTLTFMTVGYFIFKGTAEWEMSMPAHPPGLSGARSFIQEIKAYAEELQLTHMRTYSCRVNRPVRDDIQINNSFWQHVAGTDIYLYGAYYDPRYRIRGVNYHFVRLIGIVKGRVTKQIYCHLWFADQMHSSIVVQAKYVEIWMNNWDKASTSSTYRSYIFSCPVSNNHNRNNVIGVSLTLERCKKPTVFFNVSSRIFASEKPDQDLSQDTSKQDFAVCVKGMDYQNDISYRLIEWLELQYLLGASTVSMYVYNVHANMSKVLQHYLTQTNKLTVIPLTLPGDLPNAVEERSRYLKKNIWQKRRLELVPYNDCFYKHIHSHRFVVLLDIDEAIVPVIHDNWKSLVDQVLTDVPQALEVYSSISAHNVYFFDGFPTEDDNHSIPPFMHMMQHVYRSANFSKRGYSIKSFFSTNNTLAVFNHYTLLPLYLTVQRNAIISETLAQMHHYRASCPSALDVQCKTNFMKYLKRDTLLWKYKTKLVDRVLETME